MDTNLSNNLYRAHNENGEVLCYAGRVVDENLGDGFVLIASGSARFPVKLERIEPVYVGDTFVHWQHGWLRISKINRKTINCVKPDTTVIKLEI